MLRTAAATLSSYQQVDTKPQKRLMKNIEDDYVILDTSRASRARRPTSPAPSSSPTTPWRLHRGRTARQGPLQILVYCRSGKSQQAGLANTRGPRLHEMSSSWGHQQLDLRGQITPAGLAHHRQARPQPDFTKRNALKQMGGVARFPHPPHLPICTFES